MEEDPEIRPGVKISVIMGVYGQKEEKQLKDAVFSILEQSFRDFEFIIYDDGSGPETGMLLKKLAAGDRRIRLFRGEKNRGLAHGLNICIRHSRGTYIARMDADDISAGDRLEKQYLFLENHPEYGFAGSSAWLLDGHGVWGIRYMPENPGSKDFLRFSPYIHPSVLFRKEVFKEYGLYSEAKKHLRCEDYELFLRLYQRGCRGFNIREPLFFYREDETAYGKRKYRYRLRECVLRFRGFSRMGLLSGKGVLYALRPLLLGAVPGSWLYRWKKKRESWEGRIAEK